MPELPEVETMKRGLAPIVGSRIVSVARARCRLQPIAIFPRPAALRRRATGQRITGLSRAGKRVLVEFESGDAIVFEPRMTGLVLLADPPDAAHVRLRIALAGGPAAELLFWDRRGLGSVSLLTVGEREERFGLGRLGPDALLTTAASLRTHLGRSRRPIKVALLDQRALAGVGNLYASEILYRARIHPGRPCCLLEKEDWPALARAIRQVLKEAIQHEGSTLSDGTYRNALNQAGDYQNHHRVYARAELPCPGCGQGRIVRIVQAQRSTFYCPVCQAGR